jgi:hypothetical protein
MAVLQQANTNLAQKQVSNATPAHAQNQSAVQVQNQNGEAIIKAVQDAIDVGAEIYQKMDDASVDLELKDEQARMAEHFNNQAVLRENGIGTVNPKELNPQTFRQTYEKEGGTITFGDGKLAPFEASKDLSDRAANLIGPSIKVANSNFTRDTQISFAKELKVRGRKNLELNQGLALESFQATLSKPGSLIDAAVGSKAYTSAARNAAEENSDTFKWKLDDALKKGYINQPDADEKLRQYNANLAQLSMVHHMSKNYEQAVDLLESGYSYNVHGVPVDPKIQLGFVQSAAEKAYQKNKKLNLASMKIHIKNGASNKHVPSHRQFMKLHYNIETKDGIKSWVPDKYKAKEIAEATNTPIEDVLITLKDQAGGVKMHMPGSGYDSTKFEYLLDAQEQWFAKGDTYTDKAPDSPYSIAKKAGILELLNSEQNERYADLENDWSSISALSKTYTQYSIPHLIEQIDNWGKEFKDNGKFKRGKKNFDNLLLTIEPYLELAKTDKMAFGLMKLNLDERDNDNEAQILEVLKEFGLDFKPEELKLTNAGKEKLRQTKPVRPKSSKKDTNE